MEESTILTYLAMSGDLDLATDPSPQISDLDLEICQNGRIYHFDVFSDEWRS